MTLKYVMRGYRIASPIGLIYWTVNDTPDTNGSQSGFVDYAANITNIIVNSTYNTSNSDISGIPISTTPPVDKASLIYSVANTQYDIRKLSLDDLSPAFAISSFSGGSNVEIGFTVNNPSFTASYSLAPISATITNDNAIYTPHVLTTPFISTTIDTTISGGFQKLTASTITFTLTAIGATTKFAYSYINFYARSFAGVGTAGATSATADSATAVLVGATGTLANEGLKSTDVGATTASLSPLSTGQKIYYLCPHTATVHAFHDQSGFSFPMNSPTTFSFTNQYTAALSYDLYESTNLCYTPFKLTVVS